MKHLRVHRTIDAPSEHMWRLLTDPDQWSRWGPSVRAAQLDQPVLAKGTTGTVSTVVGLRLRFEITEYVELSDNATGRWGWKVAGVGATDHTVEHISNDHCRVGFGVPGLAAPYLLVCRLALARLDVLAKSCDSV